MQTIASPPPAPTRRRAWKKFVLFAVLLVGVPLAYVWHHATAGRRDLEAVLAEIDRREPGWRLAELRARYRAHPVPDDRNAARQVLKVVAAATVDIDNAPVAALFPTLESTPRNTRLGQADAAALRRFLVRENAAREAAFRLADLAEGAFDPAQDPDGLRMQDARRVRLWLWLDIALRADEGDGDGALAAFRGTLNAVRTYGIEPGGHGLIWCKQFSPEIVALSERVLAHTEPSEAALAQVQARLEREATLELRQALRERRAMAWSQIEQVLDGKAGIPTNALTGIFTWSRLSAILPIATPANGADYLRGMQRLLDAVEAPLDGRLDALLQMTQQWQAGEPVFGYYVQSAEQAIWEHYWSQTYARLAITAVAAERYRRRHGAWPATLHALVEAGLLRGVPLDPVDGQPLRWDRTADGVAVRSARYGAFRLWNVSARRQPAPVLAE